MKTDYGPMHTAYAVSECPQRCEDGKLYGDYVCAACNGSGVRVDWVKASSELEAILRERDREVDGD